MTFIAAGQQVLTKSAHDMTKSAKVANSSKGKVGHLLRIDTGYNATHIKPKSMKRIQKTNQQNPNPNQHNPNQHNNPNPNGSTRKKRMPKYVRDPKTFSIDKPLPADPTAAPINSTSNIQKSNIQSDIHPSPEKAVLDNITHNSTTFGTIYNV